MCSIFGDAHNKHKNVPFINQHANTHFMDFCMAHKGKKSAWMAGLEPQKFLLSADIHFYLSDSNCHNLRSQVYRIKVKYLILSQFFLIFCVKKLTHIGVISRSSNPFLIQTIQARTVEQLSNDLFLILYLLDKITKYFIWMWGFRSIGEGLSRKNEKETIAVQSFFCSDADKDNSYFFKSKAGVIVVMASKAIEFAYILPCSAPKDKKNSR